jgi:hypothetical protein
LLKGSGRLEVSPTRFELSFTSADLSLTSTLPVHFAAPDRWSSTAEWDICRRSAATLYSPAALIWTPPSLAVLTSTLRGAPSITPRMLRASIWSAEKRMLPRRSPIGGKSLPTVSRLASKR